MSVPDARRSAAGARRRFESAPRLLGGWVSAALITVALLLASVPLAADEGVTSLVIAVALSLAGGLALKHPLVAATVIGAVLTATLSEGAAPAGAGALASPVALAACAARGELRMAIGMATWHVLAAAAAAGLRADEAQHLLAQLMHWLLLQGAAILAGTWGHSQARRAGAERARRVTDLAEQRRTIARELHDTGVRAMTHVAMLAESGARPSATAAGDVEERAGDSETFQRISATARQATEEMRQVLDVLRSREEHAEDPALPTLFALPAPVDACGPPAAGVCAASLASALEGTRLRLAADGFTVRVHLEGEDSVLPLETVAVLSRCLGEIEANVRRHGDRRTQVALLAQAGAALDLMVLNGVVDDAVPAVQGGDGLLGMSERLAGIGGTVETVRDGNRFLTRLEIPGELEAA